MEVGSSVSRLPAVLLTRADGSLLVKCDTLLDASSSVLSSLVGLYKMYVLHAASCQVM
jgi:hypothetical protein